MESSVVLINMFEVQAGREAEFIAWWRRCSEALKQERGFIDATLHQNLRPDASFQFMNVAHWETAEAWKLALERHRETLQPTQGAKGHPMLYKVVSQY